MFSGFLAVFVLGSVATGVAHAGAPAVRDVTGGCDEDGRATLTLVGGDPDGDSFRYVVATPPAYGKLQFAGTRATYTPTRDWSGTDTFTFTAIDGTGAVSAPATGTVTVRAVNDAPVAADGTSSGPRDTSQRIPLSATDVDGPSLAYSIATSPAHGTVSVVGASVVYTPESGYVGDDTFTFTVSDGALSDTGTVAITVTRGANTAPVATSGVAAGDEDTAITTSLTASDADGDPLSFRLVRAPAHGTVTLAGDVATYTPNPDWSGTDTFSWRASDGRSASATATTTLTVAPVNDAPVATAGSATTSQDTPVTFRLASTDVDATAPPTYAVATPPTNGSLVIVGASATYTPDAGWSGADRFTFTASDGSATSSPAAVTLTVSPASEPPTAWTSYGHVAQGGTVDLAPAWTDSDSASGTFSVVTAALNGRVRVTSSGFQYTPNLGFYGVDRFTWEVTADGASASATMYVNVHPAPLLARPDVAQLGLNGIEFGHGASMGDWTSVDPQFQPDTIFADFASLGVQVFRHAARGDLMWSTIERADDNFQDADANEVLTNDTYQPIATLFEVQYASPTPPWCGGRDPFQKIMGAPAYDYLDHVVDEYADTVDSFELGNEMWHWVAASGSGGGSDAEALPDCVPRDGYSPAEQAVFLEAAARYLKVNDPDALVILPSVVPANSLTDEWITDVVTTAGDTDWFDFVTYHEYNPWGTANANRDDLTTLLDDLGLSGKLVRLTETGSSSDAGYTDRTDYPNSDDTQCADVFRRALVGWGHGDATVMWHTYLPLGEVEDTGEFQGFELAEFDGTWKPAAYSFALLSESLVPFRQITPYGQGGRYLYEVITEDGLARYVAWGSGRYTVPAGVTEYTSVVPDTTGAFTWTSVAEGDSLSLSSTPILLR